MILAIECAGLSASIVAICQVSCWILSFWAFDEDESDGR
jgi:hypothetical protein